jgi:hypothetical protein
MMFLFSIILILDCKKRVNTAELTAVLRKQVLLLFYRKLDFKRAPTIQFPDLVGMAHCAYVPYKNNAVYALLLRVINLLCFM